MVEETKPVEEDVSEEEEMKEHLPFPTAAVVREMKKHVNKDKMIKKEVKIGMNKLLGEIVAEIAKKMDENPYTMLDYRMLKEAAEPFKKVKQLQRDKEKIQKKLDSIIQDCQSLKEDLEDKFGEAKTVL